MQAPASARRPGKQEAARRRAAFFCFTHPFAAGCPPPGFVTRWLSIWRTVLRHNQTMKLASATAFRSSSAGGGRRSSLAVAALLALAGAGAHAADGPINYQCPGFVFTNTITAKEAEAKGCKPMVVQQPTTIPAPKVHTSGGAAAAPGNSASSKVDAQEQKARDSDARKILQDELIKAQAQLDALQKEYNNGQPERLGDEKNYQKYLDRTASLKASIDRTQSDIAAITRELGKTP